MNKILFLLGMVFCLDASARVAIVNENNNQTFVITYIFDEMKDFFKGKRK